MPEKTKQLPAFNFIQVTKEKWDEELLKAIIKKEKSRRPIRSYGESESRIFHDFGSKYKPLELCIHEEICKLGSLIQAQLDHSLFSQTFRVEFYQESVGVCLLPTPNKTKTHKERNLRRAYTKLFVHYQVENTHYFLLRGINEDPPV